MEDKGNYNKLKDNTMYRSDVVSNDVLDEYNNIENQKMITKLVEKEVEKLIEKRLSEIDDIKKYNGKYTIREN